MQKWLYLLSFACALNASAQSVAKPPYPRSKVITHASWDFSNVVPLRKAQGSDIWPCTWADDDQLYCAWGDGGGFGSNDAASRASLGFARVEGTPAAGNPNSYRGTNIWGIPPSAGNLATFGGKVGSMIAVDGVLYATGSFFTEAHMADPVSGNGPGPLLTMAWSPDRARTWQLAPWSSEAALGSFLNFGKDNVGARDDYVYLYFKRAQDSQHVYLKRVPKSDLKSDPATAGSYHYFSGEKHAGATVKWSTQLGDAKPVFKDKNNVDGAEVVYVAAIGRYLLTVGHNPSGEPRNYSAGQVGLFEAPYPWGPWTTVDYQDDWGNFGNEGKGDYLGLRFPTKWISADGKTLWGVFSSLRSLDSFNLVQLTMETKEPLASRDEREECKEKRRRDVLTLTCEMKAR